MIRSATFRALFREATVEVHGVFFAGEERAVLRLDGIIPLVEAALPEEAPRLTRFARRQLDDEILTLRRGTLEGDALARTEDARVLAVVLPLIAVALFLAAFALAVPRRRALLWIGATMAAAGVLIAASVPLARAVAVDQVEATGVLSAEQVRVAAGEIYDAFVGGLLVWGLVLALMGAVIAGAGLEAGAAARWVRLSRLPARSNKNLVLVAMIFAVAMTFIDQTIVAIAVPELQKDLSLSSTGVQWIINGYLLSLSALFAFGGRLADIVGHKTMVIVGVIGFATASALCGATPTGDLGEAWMIFFRVVQGGFAALMFPAALAIVVSAFDIRERGKAMATFFGVTGGLTAIGPLAGGYLTEITWRAIFWVNVPVAIIALILTVRSNPSNEKHPAPLDYRGAVLVSGGMGLAILGLQQSSEWGWGDPATIGSIVVGLALLIAFVLYELRTEHPLIKISIFRDRGFAVDNALLFLMSMAFVPLFFFSSLYAQIGLEQSASEAGLYLLIFFGGFASAAQIGGRILDQRGARGRGRARRHHRGRRIRALGAAAARPRPEQPVVLDRDDRRGHGADARPGVDRRRQPRPAHELRRGHRDHPDRAQLRRQPRPGPARARSSSRRTSRTSSRR